MITISELFSQTTQLIRAHYRTFGIYILLLIAPTIFFVLLQQVIIDTDTAGIALMNNKNAIIGIITRAVITISMLWATIGVIYATNTLLITKQEPDIRHDISKATRMVIPSFILSIIITALVFVSFLFLVIPGIIVSIWLGFSYHMYLLEHTSLLQAMKRSKELVSGKFWEIFFHFAIIGVASTIFVFTVSIIPTIVLPLLNLDYIIPFVGYLTSAFSTVYISISITVLFRSLIQSSNKTLVA